MQTNANDLLIPISADLAAAMAAIDRNAQRAVFVVAAAGEMKGLLTDGDIRRAILRGSPLNTPVSEIMRADFVSLPDTASQEEILEKLAAPISIIPLLDRAGRPTDFARFDKFHRLPVMEPVLAGRELDYVVECIANNWISSQGPFVRRFEQLFTDFLGTGSALAVSNGTVALHLALTTLGIGPGDEVIVPDLTFAASVNAVIHAGATPVLADVCADTWTLDPEAVRHALTDRTRAIMPVHLYGHPCHMDEIMALAARAGCFVIEDCAQSLGSEYKDALTGTMGDAACFSFFANKVVTTGEGGMVVFRDPDRAQHARILRDHGMSPERRYWHEHVGFNYRMTNLQAAVGLAQLERIDTLLNRRDEIRRSYDSLLEGIPGVEKPPVSGWGRHVLWLYCILFDADPEDRSEILRELSRRGIDSRPLFHPLHEMPPYRAYARKEEFYPVATRLSQTGVSLPSGYTLRDSDIRYIAAMIRDTTSIFANKQLEHRAS